MSSSNNNSTALQFEIVSHSFSERERGRRGGSSWGEPRIYVHVTGEGVFDQLVERHNRPYNVWKKQILPAALELLRAHMLTQPTACYSWSKSDPTPKTRWSQRAGCSCPCSPGFIVKTTHNHDLHVDVTLKQQQWGDLTKKVQAEIADDDSPVNVNPGVDHQTGKPITDEPTGFAIPAPPAAKHHALTLETKSGHFEGRGRIFRVAGSENAAGYGIGGWDSTASGRVEFGGPEITGPVGYLFGLAGVIDCNGGTGKAHSDAEADGRMFDAADGDTVTVNGIEFKLTVTSRGYPKLDAVADPVAASLDFEPVQDEADYLAHLDSFDNDSDYRAATEQAAQQFGAPTSDPKIIRFRA